MASRVTVVGVDDVVRESGGPCWLGASVPAQRSKLFTRLFVCYYFSEAESFFFQAAAAASVGLMMMRMRCLSLSERENTDDDDHALT